LIRSGRIVGWRFSPPSGSKMPRDQEIKRAFEIADDGVQGVIGYFLYGIACKKAACTNAILSHLPQKTIQITHEWKRYYSPDSLLHVMNKYFEPYNARVALISVVGIFEGALGNFIKRLVATNRINRQPKRNYKDRLEWAFKMALKSTYGTQSMLARIPDLCLNVDHARRIRNLWMHNNGLFDARYANDCISISGSSPIIDPSFLTYQKIRKRKVPVILKPKSFLVMSYSHIELLHHLHHFIQKTYYGQKISYSYKALKKQIEWYRLLIGV